MLSEYRNVRNRGYRIFQSRVNTHATVRIRWLKSIGLDDKAIKKVLSKLCRRSRVLSDLLDHHGGTVCVELLHEEVVQKLRLCSEIRFVS